MLRTIKMSIATAAALVVLGQNAGAQTEQAQPVQTPAQTSEVPTVNDKVLARTHALKDGTFVLRPGLDPWICVTPKLPVFDLKKISLHKRHVRAVQDKLKGLLVKAPASMRAKLKDVLEIVAKLKDPCGGDLPHVMMGTSARCQGSSGNP